MHMGEGRSSNRLISRHYYKAQKTIRTQKLAYRALGMGGQNGRHAVNLTKKWAKSETGPDTRTPHFTPPPSLTSLYIYETVPPPPDACWGVLFMS